jgi:hypothetical protein
LTIEFLFVSFKKIFHITTQNIYLFICLIHLRADLSSSLDCVSHYPSYIQLFYIFSWVYVSLLRKDFLLTVNYFGWIGIPNSNVSMCHLWSWFTSSNLSSDILQVLPVLNVTLQQWALDVDRHCESSLSLFAFWDFPIISSDHSFQIQFSVAPWQKYCSIFSSALHWWCSVQNICSQAETTELNFLFDFSSPLCSLHVSLSASVSSPVPSCFCTRSKNCRFVLG